MLNTRHLIEQVGKEAIAKTALSSAALISFRSLEFIIEISDNEVKVHGLRGT